MPPTLSWSHQTLRPASALFQGPTQATFMAATKLRETWLLSKQVSLLEDVMGQAGEGDPLVSNCTMHT